MAKKKITKKKIIRKKNDELLSQNAYARHRGITLYAVQKKLKSGIITYAPGTKLIPRDEADRLWEMAKDPSQVRAPQSEREKREREKRGEVFDHNPSGEFKSVADWKVEKEKYAAKKAKAEYEEKSGELIRINEVLKIIEDEYSKVRSALFQVPSKAAQKMALITDPAEVQEGLLNLINEVLENLTMDAEENVNKLSKSHS
jgi:hypothetical protein